MNQPGICPQCGKPFVLSDSIEMHNYYDEEFGIWVIHWFTCDIEVCVDCEISGRMLNEDEFETPRFPEQIDRELWRKRMEQRQREQES